MNSYRIALLVAIMAFQRLQILDAVFHGIIQLMQATLGESNKMPCWQAVQRFLTYKPLLAIAQGASRMNVGVFKSGTGRNVTPDIAVLKLETRGATTDINDYMIERTKTIIKGAAEMHDCTFEITKQS